MHSLEYIDDYFKGDFSPKEKMEFEKKLAEDPNFADDVAFYISTRQVSKDLVIEEKKNNFKRIYAEYNKEAKVIPMRRIWSYSAAAAVFVAIVISWFLFMKPPTTTQLADNYINENLTHLQVTMGSQQDSMQMAVSLYNDGKYNESLAIFEAIVASRPKDNKALEFAGITALRIGNYEKSIQYFSRLERMQLAYNPGAFYHALTLMKRNGPGDADEAKRYLEKVVNEGLEHKEEAPALLKRL